MLWLVLIFVGVALIFIGTVLLFVSSLLWVHRPRRALGVEEVEEEGRERRVEYGGFVLIGPIPIVFGSRGFRLWPLIAAGIAITIVAVISFLLLSGYIGPSTLHTSPHTYAPSGGGSMR